MRMRVDTDTRLPGASGIIQGWIFPSQPSLDPENCDIGRGSSAGTIPIDPPPAGRVSHPFPQPISSPLNRKSPVRSVCSRSLPPLFHRLRVGPRTVADSESRARPGRANCVIGGDVEQGPVSAPTLLMAQFAMPGRRAGVLVRGMDARRRRVEADSRRGRTEGAHRKNFDTHLRRRFHGGTRAFFLLIRLPSASLRDPSRHDPARHPVGRRAWR